MSDAQTMEHNYFTEIEEHFCRLRGGAMLLSPRDWTLIEQWEKGGVSLQAALKGIERAFENHRKRPGSGRVNSLAYCDQAVHAAAAEAARVELAHPSAGDPFPPDKLAKYLTSNAQVLTKAAEKYEGNAGTELRAIAVELLQLANGCLDVETNKSLEQYEQDLVALENRMVVALEGAAKETALASWRFEFRSTLEDKLSKMDGEQRANLERQFLDRKLLDKAGLPRLSLFYMEQ